MAGVETERGPAVRPLGRVAAWMELARASNLPTCASNVLVGCAIASGGAALPWLTAGSVFVSIALLYVGGMALNDVMDAAHDREHRRDRPIAVGRLSISGARRFAVVMLAAGGLVAALHGSAAALMATALVAAIVGYNWLHKRFAAAAVLMGLCRGLVYGVAAAAVAWPADVAALCALAGGLTLYTLLVTVVARGEAGTPRPNRLAAWLLPLVVLPTAAIIHKGAPQWIATAGGLLTGYLASVALLLHGERPRVLHAVQRQLAGISLVDAFFLVLLGYEVVALAAVGCFVLTVAGHVRIRGS